MRAVITVLGGSSAFTPALASELAARRADLPPLELRLFGRDAARLEAVSQCCGRVARAAGADHRFTWTTDLEQAVRDARVVVCQVRVGGWAGREHDERFPLDAGLPGDETIGPGGLASALRSVPVVLELAERVARVAPDAWFLLLTNPLGILAGALQRVSGLKSFGLCELPDETARRAGRALGRPAHWKPDRVEYVGLNHQGWIVRLEERGRDLLGEVFDALEAPEVARAFGIDADVARTWGALPLPYLRLYLHREREVAALRARGVSRGAELERLAHELFAAYRAGETAPASLAARPMPWIRDATVPALVALLGGPAAELYVTEPNGSHLANLAPEAIVEKRCQLDARGPRALPLCLGDVPDGAARPLAFLRELADYEARALEAALAPTEASVISALRAHPFGIDRATARALAPKVLAPVGSEPIGSTLGKLAPERKPVSTSRTEELPS